jgi:hypothetical protein
MHDHVVRGPRFAVVVTGKGTVLGGSVEGSTAVDHDKKHAMVTDLLSGKE